jgi:hypothetical protein
MSASCLVLFPVKFFQRQARSQKDVAEFENSSRFGEVQVRRYEWEERYTTTE